LKKLAIVLRLFVFFLSVTILLTGCNSFYTISKDDYDNLDKMNEIKIVYKNGKEFIVVKGDTTNVKIVGDSLIVYQGAEKKYIGIGEIESLKESRFDFGGTIIMTILFVAFWSVIFFIANLF
jgi:hypothetical protein